MSRYGKRTFRATAPNGWSVSRSATGASDWNFVVFFKRADQEWEIASWKTTRELAEREYRSYAKHFGADSVQLQETERTEG
jgi:hypothetical protein